MAKTNFMIAALLVISVMSVFCGGQGEQAKAVALECSTRHSEYHAQFRQVWDLYEEEYPNVKVTLFHVNEDTTKLFNARIASGDPPDFCIEIQVSQFNYTNFVDLQTIGYEHFDKWPYDYAEVYKKYFGLDNYVPIIGPFAGPDISFMYYKDDMEKTGLNPRDTVRTIDDLKTFLVKLKEYVNSRPDLDYVWDTGFHPGMWSDQRFLTEFAGMFGADIGKDDLDLYFGRKRWDDKEQNCFAPVLEFIKDMTVSGILPANWTSRQWEQDFENSFINRKTMFAAHGPWMWNKILASNPDAQLSGFPFPANEHGYVYRGEPYWSYGGGIFTDGKDRPHYNETVKAFKWYFTPEIIKIIGEALGQTPIMDVSTAGKVNIQTPQFVEVVNPTEEGQFGDITIISPFLAYTHVQKYLKKGKPMVIKDQLQANYYQDYFTGKMSLQDMLDIWQKKWEDSYDIP